MPRIIVYGRRDVIREPKNQNMLLEALGHLVAQKLGFNATDVGGLWVVPSTIHDTVQLHVDVEFSASIWKLWKVMKWKRILQTSLSEHLKRSSIVPSDTIVGVWIRPQWQAGFDSFMKHW